MESPIPPSPARLWRLPLLVAVLPLLVTHLALWLSIRDGHVPGCIPYFEGCTSISRAARHGLGNHLFRMVMLPMAVILWLHWVAARDWLRLRSGDVVAGRNLRWMGTVAAAALAVYATFLGSEGEMYQWMRRYGITLYFAFNYLCMLVSTRRLLQLGDAPRLARAQLAAALLALALGLGNVGAGVIDDPHLKDRIENMTEWNVGLMFTAWFLLQAAVWRRSGYVLRPVLGEVVRGQRP